MVWEILRFAQDDTHVYFATRPFCTLFGPEQGEGLRLCIFTGAGLIFRCHLGRPGLEQKIIPQPVLVLTEEKSIFYP